MATWRRMTLCPLGNRYAVSLTFTENTCKPAGPTVRLSCLVGIPANITIYYPLWFVVNTQSRWRGADLVEHKDTKECKTDKWAGGTSIQGACQPGPWWNRAACRRLKFIDSNMWKCSVSQPRERSIAWCLCPNGVLVKTVHSISFFFFLFCTEGKIQRYLVACFKPNYLHWPSLRCSFLSDSSSSSAICMHLHHTSLNIQYILVGLRQIFQ